MRLSIIIPTCNCAAELQGMFDSIICQTCTDYEVIIVDGASTDGTMEIVYANRSRFPKGCLQYVSEPDGGVYDAMNKGVSVSHGEWLYFMGADDRLYDRYSLDNLFAFLDDSVDMVLCDIHSPKHGRCSSGFSWMTYLRNTVHHQGVVYRRGLFADRGYDVTLQVMGDYEMNLYLYKRGCRMRRARFILAEHLPGGLSGSMRWINYSEEIRVRNRYLGNPVLRMLCAGVSVFKFCVKQCLC